MMIKQFVPSRRFAKLELISIQFFNEWMHE